MATRTLRFDVLEINLIIEVEAEETMLFKVLIIKLKTEGHLDSADTYFIFTQNGVNVRENDLVRNHAENYYILTLDAGWRSKSTIFLGDAPIYNIPDGIIVNNNSKWFMSFLKRANWNEVSIQSQLMVLENIAMVNGKRINVKALVQYSPLAHEGVQNTTDKYLKMNQVLSTILDHEVKNNGITDANFYNSADLLAANCSSYLDEHMRLVWNTKIEQVVFAGFE